MSLSYLSNADLAEIDRDEREDCIDDLPCCRHCGFGLDGNDFHDTLECRGCSDELASEMVPMTREEASELAKWLERLDWSIEWAGRIECDWSSSGIGGAL